MAKAAYILLCVLSLSQASLSFGNTPQDLIAFAQGFLQGVELSPSSPSACGLDLSTALSHSESIVVDIQGLIEGTQGSFTNLVLDLEAGWNYVKPICSNCHFEPLIAQLKQLMSPDGAKILFINYYKNIKVISENLQEVEDCGSDYNACGNSYGEIFKLLVGWTLDGRLHAEVKYEAASMEYIQIVKGFVNGLQATPGAASECYSDANLVLGNLETFLKDLEEVFMGGSGSVMKLLKSYKALVNNLPNLNTECNVVVLYQQIIDLMGPNGLVNLYKRYNVNQEAINNDLGVVSVCADDFFACGQGLGSMVSLLVGWTI